jgi:hypothetical protein
MRPPLVEVRDVLGQDLTQVTLIEDEGLIQALLSDRSHPSLGNWIGLWRSEWDTNLSDSQALEPSVEERPITAIAVMDENARGLSVPSAAFHDLLRRAFRRRMLGHPDMYHLAACVMDYEKGIEGLEP